MNVRAPHFVLECSGTLFGWQSIGGGEKCSCTPSACRVLAEARNVHAPPLRVEYRLAASRCRCLRTAREVLLAILIAWALVISQTTPHVTDHVQCASTDTYSPQGDTLHADEGNRRVQLCEMFVHQPDEGNRRVQLCECSCTSRTKVIVVCNCVKCSCTRRTVIFVCTPPSFGVQSVSPPANRCRRLSVVTCLDGVRF